jgi:hypothetical protein
MDFEHLPIQPSQSINPSSCHTGKWFASLFILSRNAWEFLTGHLLIQPFQPTNDFSYLFMTHEKICLPLHGMGK